MATIFVSVSDYKPKHSRFITDIIKLLQEELPLYSFVLDQPPRDKASWWLSVHREIFACSLFLYYSAKGTDPAPRVLAQLKLAQHFQRPVLMIHPTGSNIAHQHRRLIDQTLHIPNGMDKAEIAERIAETIQTHMDRVAQENIGVDFWANRVPEDEPLLPLPPIAVKKQFRMGRVLITVPVLSALLVGMFTGYEAIAGEPLPDTVNRNFSVWIPALSSPLEADSSHADTDPERLILDASAIPTETSTIADLALVASSETPVTPPPTTLLSINTASSRSATHTSTARPTTTATHTLTPTESPDTTLLDTDGDGVQNQCDQVPGLEETNGCSYQGRINITSDFARVRSGPSSKAEIVGRVANQSNVTLLAISPDAQWYAIRYIDSGVLKMGWIASSLLVTEYADVLPVRSE